MTEPDALAEHEIGWRMALCAAELARASGEDDPAGWEAVRPAVQARPAPFLEAYVLWRAAEAYGGRGEAGAAAERLRAAHAIATRIGAAPLTARIESLGRRMRVDFGAGRAPAAEGRTGTAVAAGSDGHADSATGPRSLRLRPIHSG